jgi:predicted RNase H-like HicB family nuclease
MGLQLHITIERDDGGFSAFCPELEGFRGRGESFEDVMEDFRVALEAYWGTLETDERPVLSVEDLSDATVAQ